ncbi:MAG: IS21 family transposase [Mesorhizobium sp.]|uniref:IS21 family transposase n=4 Tax=Mesorhizobium sp. TaxID=1871066 RepID=UPI000FE77676|nr:IS21 family transposase [Mesorhizobium sp.]RWA95055.1 MAG: IS21 family transposase [Mesorhizobium sp.]RWK58115.1 MAG: IS21 family transposase [Mesorhizobium sp.]RWM39125.1 MAG: IS21 family transposase [Mesorhizobium sp.]RWM43259.1 MAG: IS21 family transposase [Mesorhizobium sp.]RWM77374.1 MAG: IS21 family transposase [Mesorhizobium sp.]
MTIGISAIPALSRTMQGEEMLQPEEVAAMLRLHELGWGAKRLAKEFGCARNTVRRYLREGGTVPFRRPVRPTAFDGLDNWLRERFFRHGGNADVVRQELASEHGIVIGLRSVELRVQGWRRELRAQKRATVRFETAPGHQMQIDFGDTRAWIGGERVRVHLFVATLGYSRRLHIRPSLRERQADWFEGMEGAFLRFGGVPTEVLFDNPKALVEHHDATTREVRFNMRLHAFARYWGFTPRACAPYRARTKGKDERGVGYVKRNAIAGRRFENWAAFEAHLDRWTREIADRRVHGTTGVAPAERFAEEAGALRPLGGRAPFGQLRDLVRKVQADCAIDLDTNSYSVPWRLIGESVQVVVLGGRVIVRHAGEVVADHALCRGRRQRIVERAHLAGVVGAAGPVRSTPAEIVAPSALLRPLAEYEALVGGGW